MRISGPLPRCPFLRAARPRLPRAVAALPVALAAAATVFAADHRDTPFLDPGRLNTDITDLYAFGRGTNTVVMGMAYSPDAGVGGSLIFDVNALYQVSLIDVPTTTPTGFKADLAYRVVFGPPQLDGNQAFTLYEAVGSAADGHTLAGSFPIHNGVTNQNTDIPGGGKFFAGLRSDPFFFDFDALLGAVEGTGNGRTFNDGSQVDFFADLDVLAIVLELPDSLLPDATGDGFAVWASTATFNGIAYDQVDRMGRPLINTLVNSAGPIVGAPASNKDLFNASHPGDDAQFVPALRNALAALSALDAEGSYQASPEIDMLVDEMLPDMLFFNRNSSRLPPFNAAPFNGRDLDEDVVDILLNIFSGGFPFSGRDAVGGIATDGIGPHSDYLAEFPYLGARTISHIFASGFEDGEMPSYSNPSAKMTPPRSWPKISSSLLTSPPASWSPCHTSSGTPSDSAGSAASNAGLPVPPMALSRMPRAPSGTPSGSIERPKISNSSSTRPPASSSPYQAAR